MNAILGRIERIVPASDTNTRELHAYDVTVVPYTLLPDSRPLPAWLEDREITVKRSSLIREEIGMPGDSLPLTVSESDLYLNPLVIETGDSVRLQWRAPEPPKEIRVTANGRTAIAPFVDGLATIALSDIAAPGFERPSTAKLTAGKFTRDFDFGATASIPSRYTLGGDERTLSTSLWYAVEYERGAFAGAIASLRERGRAVDHLAERTDRVGVIAYDGHHADRLRSGWRWDDRLKSVSSKSVGTRRNALGERVYLECLVDEGQALRSSVAYQLYDAFPLLGYTREFSFGPPKPDETPGPKKPKSPIDTLVDIGMGVRCATCDSADSRVIVLNDGRIRSHRLVVPRRNHDMPFSKLASGWALTEHADRLEWMLHLFDPSSPPRLGVNINAYSLIVEPFWERTPTKPGDALGYSVGIACGEAAGASAEGVWIAARRPTATGIAVGIVARLSVACSRRDVALVVGQQTFETELIATTTEFGPLQFATIDLRDIAPDTPVALTVAGIAARRGK